MFHEGFTCSETVLMMALGVAEALCAEARRIGACVASPVEPAPTELLNASKVLICQGVEYTQAEMKH